jgi:non-ribosomal peptide synthase protein (TIGR01720 family)
VIFNYLGQFDQIRLSPSPEEASQPVEQVQSWLKMQDLQAGGEALGPLNPRNHLLDVNALVIGGQLHVQWTYSEQLHRQATIKALAQEFLQALRALLAHSLQPGAGALIPSDFPLVRRLDQAMLDQLLAGYEGQIEDCYPLTPLQQGILFHTLYAPR